MDQFANKPKPEKIDFFREAANRLNLGEIIVEKDFWVCWTLKRLFLNSVLSPVLTFKGGTSLSKAYGLIERFSEDIDLTISRNAPIMMDGKDPMEPGISGKERARRIDALKQNAQRFVIEVALPALQADIRAELGDSEWRVVLDAEDPDQQTILFYYPKVLDYNSGRRLYGAGTFGSGTFGTTAFGEGDVSIDGYIRPHIKLEFGARGEIDPHESRRIQPYIAETFSDLFENPHCEVSTLAAERTFWEKATILHALHHGTKLRDRMSRHYYDTYVLMQKGIADKALEMPELLESVVRNKSLMFADTKASYETARMGSLKLMPSAENQEILKRDYEKMTEMFMGEYPEFDTVMEQLAVLEERIARS